MSKIQLGDIFEIKTPKGSAYLHFIAKDTMGIEVVRVLSDLYQKRPESFDELIKKKERYIISFPLKSANNKNIVEKVGHISSDGYHYPQFMRTPHNIRGEFLGWHIVNTSTLIRKLVSKLSTEQKKLSPWGVWNDTLLIDRLANNWKLEEWEPWD